MSRRAPIADRFWAKVEKTKGCWEWTGSTNNHGYGRLFWASPRTTRAAHRISWELCNGPIPDGMHVCHHCDNRKCVRPDHLFLGDDAANMLDARLKGRLRKVGAVREPGRGPRNSHCRRGHPFSPENSYIAPSLTYHCRACLRVNWLAKYHRQQQLKEAIP